MRRAFPSGSPIWVGYHTMMQLPTRIPLLTTAFGLSAVWLAAETSPLVTTEEVVALERFVVTAVPIEDSINPLVRPIQSVFGDDRSILETPRAVSTISQALLRERGINGVAEFVAYAPGSSAPASYGKATIPNIRGDLAETFINGQRISYNNFGYTPSFNSVEAVEVIRGPGSAIYGSGFFTGGYVNYVTKAPKFIAETTLTTRTGTWVPDGGSWLNASWQIDATAPWADGKSAWRVSYEGKEDATFFRRHGGRDDREDLFVSWIRKASDSLTVEANAQYMWQAAPQLLGVNRPTQELIDHGRYYTGDVADLGYNDATGALAGTIAGTSWVDLPRDATLLSPGDYSNARVVRSQFSATLQLGDAGKLVNRTLVEYVDRSRYHAFEYAEYATQWTAENRTEWYRNFDLLGQPHQLAVGGTIRWEDRLSYTNYYNEYFFQYDITRANRVFSHAADYPSSYWPGYVGPDGKRFFAAADDCPETTDSTLWNPAVFVQDDIQLTKRISLLVGLRGDGFFARATDPLGTQTGSPVWHDTNDDTACSWNASVTYRLTPKASLYATYQRAYAVRGNVTGGGIRLKKLKLSDGTKIGVIDPDDFKNLSRLAEVGAKFSLLDNKLYAGVALYDQRRQEVTFRGKVENLRLQGAEVELVYQPDTHLNATFNVAYTDGHFAGATALGQSGGASLYNLYALGAGPGGLGNGIGFTWDELAGDYRIPGLSRWMINSSASYQFASGFGGGFGGSWQSEQPGNLLNEYHLPAQIFLSAFLFYRQPKWEVNLDLLNVLNRRNWIHNGDTWSNNVLVFQDLPLRLEGYVKYRF